MFDVALEHLAPFGRLVCIGAVSEHAGGLEWEKVSRVRVYQALLGKSASISTCLLMLHPHEVWRRHFERLLSLLDEGTLQAAVDPVIFEGLTSVPAAVQHLQDGRNWGKVVVRLG
jgi:NADPH-dependent curcumin reductase CurA